MLGNQIMKRLNENNCGDIMSLEELQKIQLKMLKTFADFCIENDIRYYLSGGTLLGAIRHQGFIPWDDDVDVNVPRPDCIKLQELSCGHIGPYILQKPDVFSPYHAESWRLYDPSVVIASSLGGTSKMPVYYAAFIDIFPIEGLPSSKINIWLHYFKLVCIRKLMRCSTVEYWSGKNFPAKIFHLVAGPFAKMVGYKNWYKWMQRIVAKYSFDDSELIGVMTAPVHTTEEIIRKQDYLEPISVKFEGFDFCAPSNFDVYLTQLYGDYMKMPPKGKQVSHHSFKFYHYRESD